MLGCADNTDWSQFCVGLCRHHRLVTVLWWVVQTSQTGHSYMLCYADIAMCGRTGLIFVLCCADIVTCVAGPALTTAVVSSPTVTLPGPSFPTEAGPFALPAHPRIEVKVEPLRYVVSNMAPFGGEGGGDLCHLLNSWKAVAFSVCD